MFSPIGRFFFTAALLGMTQAPNGWASDSLPVRMLEVGDRKQLFIDDLFFETSENISLQVHPPLKTGERTLVSDQPWEDATLNWFSVLEATAKSACGTSATMSRAGRPPTTPLSVMPNPRMASSGRNPPLDCFTYHGSRPTTTFSSVKLGPDRAALEGPWDWRFS